MTWIDHKEAAGGPGRLSSIGRSYRLPLRSSREFSIFRATRRDVFASVVEPDDTLL